MLILKKGYVLILAFLLSQNPAFKDGRFFFQIQSAFINWQQTLLTSLVVFVFYHLNGGKSTLFNDSYNCLMKLITSEDVNFACRSVEPVTALH